METKIITRLNDFGESFERQHSFYGSEFVKALIEKGGVHASPRTGISYRIPTHFGFCYGVEKSIDMAFETTRRFPDRRIFLTHDVIHNPKVNEDLKEKGVKVLERDASGRLVLQGITPKDIVVIAAFGTRFGDVEALKERGCVIVDTTCGAIVSVWKRVEKYAKNGFTSVIHGIWSHEETQATASQAVKFDGHYLIVRNLDEVAWIPKFLKSEIAAAEFLRFFKNRTSPGFDPAVHLQKIGIASQTTMLKTETLEVQETLKGIYSEIFGEAQAKTRFMRYDTICSATQERQDALTSLLETPSDMVLIIGGFNSSNTTHLSEIASLSRPTYHIEGPEDIVSRQVIRHLNPANLKQIQTSPWLPERLERIAISTGASTPDILIEKVIGRVEEILA